MAASRLAGDIKWSRADSVPLRANGSHGAARRVARRLSGFVRRFIVMTTAQAEAVALWIVHTHTFEAAETTPYLSITSAEKRSGKTRLLEVLELLVARAWLTGRVTAAALSRKVDAVRPSLLLDESDAAFKGDKEYAETLRGLLNSGHRRGGKTTVCVGQGAEIGYKDFSTFCPKAIAGIGTLPDTVADRSLPIRLERRAPGERAERFRHRDAEGDALVLREQLERLEDLVSQLEAARPELPSELDDRAQDAAEPLLAIADLAGGKWPDSGRRALIELHGRREAEDESIGVRLLSDVHAIFAERGVDRLRGKDLLEALHHLDESPWADWYGRPLAARGLAKLLSPYGVRSRTVRLEDGTTPKGFLREQFDPVWRRYLPADPQEKRHTATTRTTNGSEPDPETPHDSAVADLETPQGPLEHWDVAEVADTERAQAELDRLRAKFGEGTT